MPEPLLHAALCERLLNVAHAEGLLPAPRAGAVAVLLHVLGGLKSLPWPASNRGCMVHPEN